MRHLNCFKGSVSSSKVFVEGVLESEPPLREIKLERVGKRLEVEA